MEAGVDNVMLAFTIIFDDRFDPAFAVFGLVIASACFLLAIIHLVLFRCDGTSRWGFKPSQSALLRTLTSLLSGHKDPNLRWQWYDYVMLLGIGMGIVAVVGFWR